MKQIFVIPYCKKKKEFLLQQTNDKWGPIVIHISDKEYKLSKSLFYTDDEIKVIIIKIIEIVLDPLYKKDISERDFLSLIKDNTELRKLFKLLINSCILESIRLPLTITDNLYQILSILKKEYDEEISKVLTIVTSFMTIKTKNLNSYRFEFLNQLVPYYIKKYTDYFNNTLDYYINIINDSSTSKDKKTLKKILDISKVNEESITELWNELKIENVRSDIDNLINLINIKSKLDELRLSDCNLIIKKYDDDTYCFAEQKYDRFLKSILKFRQNYYIKYGIRAGTENRDSSILDIGLFHDIKNKKLKFVIDDLFSTL